MQSENVKELVEQGLENARVAVQGEGNKFEILVISDQFEGMNTVRRQQAVYACINHCIADGSIHAVSIKSYTAAEWDRAQRMGLA